MYSLLGKYDKRGAFGNPKNAATLHRRLVICLEFQDDAYPGFQKSHGNKTTMLTKLFTKMPKYDGLARLHDDGGQVHDAQTSRCLKRHL